MKFEFSKLHGAGNDFIVVDDSSRKWSRSPFFISKLCCRHTGIGADGMIFLSKLDAGNVDCRMEFFNNDGHSAGMCGNGLRCAAKFAANYLFCRKKKIVFKTDSGNLNTEILEKDLVRVEIPVLEEPEKIFPEGHEFYFVNTGVPHLICLKDDISNLDIDTHGSYWRNHPDFKPNGVNVDFLEINSKSKIISIRTFERGLECESNACGTGIAAAALALFHFGGMLPPFSFQTHSNDRIIIDFSFDGNRLIKEKKVLLTGNAIEVYRGTLIKEDLSCKHR